jgi:anti-sigma B factor antagonist
MKTNKKEIGNVVLITIEDKEANLSNSDRFKAMILDEVAKGAINLIISFENVEYVDSSFLGALVAILKQLLPLKGKLTLINLNGDILNLFELTRLDKVFALKSSLDDALLDYK